MKTLLETRPPPPPLPVEVIAQIVSHVVTISSSGSLSPSSPFSWAAHRHGEDVVEDEEDEKDEQRALHACNLVARRWHLASVEALYRYPRLTSRNYDAFVRTICPSVNLHVKKTDLARLVRVLDLRQLVFAGTKSFVARLLGRVKENLEVLRAPQTSFAVNSLAALSKCHKLRVLDMGLVTESIPIIEFFKSIEKIESLEELLFPRSSFIPPKDKQEQHTNDWPSRIRSLSTPPSIYPSLIRHGPRSAIDLDSITIFGTRSGDREQLFFSSLIRQVRRLIVQSTGAYEPRDPASAAEGIFLFPNFRDIQALEIFNTNTLEPLLLLYTGDATLTAFGQPPLPVLEELVIGPFCFGEMPEYFLHEDEVSDSVWDKRPDMEHFGVSPNTHCNSIAGALALYRARYNQPPALRRIFIYLQQGRRKNTNLKFSSVWQQLIEFSRRLIELELRRKEERGTCYQVQECGIFAVEHYQGQSFEASKHTARPIFDLLEYFSPAVLSTWPHVL